MLGDEITLALPTQKKLHVFSTYRATNKLNSFFCEGVGSLNKLS